jgi:hypothetical protein
MDGKWMDCGIAAAGEAWQHFQDVVIEDMESLGKTLAYKGFSREQLIEQNK